MLNVQKLQPMSYADDTGTIAKTRDNFNAFVNTNANTIQ